MKDKVKTLKEIEDIVKYEKDLGKKIITTNGVFDILHLGHVRYLEKASKLGDILIVAVNSNNSVKQNKGNNRPINNQYDRVEVLAALQCIDYVFIFNDKDPRNFINLLKPNIHVKGGDYKLEQIMERKTVEKYGGNIKIINYEKGYSTTDLINKIKNL